MIFDAFMDQLMMKAGYGNMDSAGIDMLSDEIKPYLFEWVMTNIAAKLGEEKLGGFNQLVKDNASEQAFSSYLEKEIPDYTHFLAATLKKFETMYVEEVTKK